MKTTILALSVLFASSAIADPVIVKKSDLPALKGGKADGPKSPLPTCFGGNRAKLAASDALVSAWVESHPKHSCASASTLYVCRAGANLSVRCE